MSSTSPLHFLVLPLPGQGHLNPMLALAENLQAEGCTITVALPEQSHRKILIAAAAAPASHDLHESLHFATFPAEFSDFAGLMTVFKQQQGFLENLIESSKSTPTPISCIVSDFMLTWAQDVANKCGIPRALFWLGSATLFHIGTIAKAAGGLYPGGGRVSLGFGFEACRNTSARERKSSYVVTREEVERAVRALLGDGSSDENHVGVKLRENAHHFMGHARHALHHDSHATLLSFIQNIHQQQITKEAHLKFVNLMG